MRILQNLFVLVTVGGFLAAESSANLVSNGSFESGFDSWDPQFAGIGSNMAVTTDEAISGTRSVRFSATGAPYDSISQNLATTQGQEYQITFWVKNYGIEDDSLVVGFGATEVLNLTPVGTGLESWQFVSVNATAASNGSLLSFSGRDAQAAFYLDDVQVNAVPEPGTLAVLGLGALAIRRRSRK